MSTSTTDDRPAIAPTLMVFASHPHCGPNVSTAVATGAATLSLVNEMTPVSTAAVSMYSTVQMTSEPRMPMGMSLRGSFASWPAVETASKPMYAKKTMVAARMMPSQPNWFSTPVGSGMNGCQLAGFTKNAPTTMNAMITVTLIA